MRRSGNVVGDRSTLRRSELGRKSPLGGHEWISSPERREAAMTRHSPFAVNLPLNVRIHLET